MKSVVKGAIAVLVTFTVIGCGDYTRTADSGNTDNSITDSGNTDNSTTDNSVNNNEPGSDANGTVDDNKTAYILEGIYRQDYTPQECRDAGYFFCSIEQQCLDMPATGGTCSG